jgi:hypothetical protein
MPSQVEATLIPLNLYIIAFSVLLQLLLPFSSQKVRFFGPKISIVAPILLLGGPLFLSTGSIHIHPLMILISKLPKRFSGFSGF